MNYLEIAQYMAAAAFFSVALTHSFVWLRVPKERVHAFFAVTALAAGLNAIAEIKMYQADSLAQIASALKWYTTTSGVWIISVVWFIYHYATCGRFGRAIAILLTILFMIALGINFISPASYLYSKLTGIREILLPWGESIRLAKGEDSPIRLAFEPFLLVLVVLMVGAASRDMWKKTEHVRSMFFGLTAFIFFACFGVHAALVDSGQLDMPYLSTYGFLAIVLLMRFDLAGEIGIKSQLATKLAEVEQDLLSAVADERNRIAGDLHDSVTQTLFSTVAIADALPAVWQRHPDEAIRGLDDLKQLTRAALAEMRTLLTELRPATLVEMKLSELLTQLASATSSRSRIPVKTEIDYHEMFPAQVQVALYRSAQEALNNIVKHSNATEARVTLNRQADTVHLIVEDNGCGIEIEGLFPTSIGLSIMRERVRSISGEIEITSKPGKGTKIHVQWNRQSRKEKLDE